MVGMILLAVVAGLIFFGLTTKFFEQMGVANWVAFLVILAFAVAAVFPPIRTDGGVSVSVAGFIMPLLLGLAMFTALIPSGGAARAFVGIFAIAGVAVSMRIALPPFDTGARMACIWTVGLVGGVLGYIVGRSRMATLCCVTLGIVLGDFVCAMLFRFVTGDTGSVFALGQYGTFDSVVLGCVVGALTCLTAFALAKRTPSPRKSTRTAAIAVPIEAAQDTDLSDENKEQEAENVVENAAKAGKRDKHASRASKKIDKRR